LSTSPVPPSVLEEVSNWDLCCIVGVYITYSVMG
jgi:hypothetical protein